MLIILLLHFVITASSSNVRVDTLKGVIIGEKHDGYTSFLGVPYALVNAKYPFGNNAVFPNFTKPFKANRPDVMCPQMRGLEYKGTLQCLTLNIYVPLTETRPCPVLVWFHGESFWNGDANEYRSTYLVKQGIIFISVNYRIGPYGFFCPKEYILPGNQGMRDQIAALKWIQENIVSFNGDPNAVTIGGSGHGSGYVNILLYSKLKGLFDKAIMQSGSMFSHGFFIPPNPRYPISVAKHWGKSIGRHTVPREVIPFLNTRNQEDVIRGALLMKQPLGVCKEVKGGINTVTKNPFSQKIQKKMHNTKLLIGYNSMEKSDLLEIASTNKYYRDAGDIIYNTLEKTIKVKEAELRDLAYIVKRFYFGGKGYSPTSALNLVNAMSDFAVNNGVERCVDQLVAAGATVYKYIFSYTGASAYRNISGTGAPKMEELKFLLNWREGISGREQESIRTHMVKMWANFVKFGNPTPGHQFVLWKPVHKRARHYLNIDTKMSMMDDRFYQREAFWLLFWHSFHKRAISL